MVHPDELVARRLRREARKQLAAGERPIEWYSLTPREQEVYVKAWITGAREESKWIQERLAHLLTLPPEMLEEYIALADAVQNGATLLTPEDGAPEATMKLGVWLPPVVRELLQRALYLSTQHDQPAVRRQPYGTGGDEHVGETSSGS